MSSILSIMIYPQLNQDKTIIANTIKTNKQMSLKMIYRTCFMLYFIIQLQMLKLLLPFLITLTVLAQNNPQYDAYEKQLLRIVKNIQSDVNKISSSGNQALDTGALFNSSETLSSQVYTEAAKDIRNKITLTLGQSTIPFQLKTWNCTTIPAADYNSIVSSNNQLQASQKQFADKLSQLNSFSTCPQVEEMNTQSALLNQEIKLFQTQIAQFCANRTANGSTNAGNTSVTPLNNGSSQNTSKPTGFVNNLDNGINNWIYGNINPQLFYADVNKKLGQGAQLCSTQNPYIDINNNCISCPLLYNVAAKRCASCPSGSNLNPKIHQCDTSSGETIIKNSNPSGLNFIGNKPNAIDNLSSCPSNTPYFDGSQCISCLLPNYFDYSNSVCLACGNGQQFDANSKICKPLDNSVTPGYKKYNSNLASSVANYVGMPPQAANNIEGCPNTQPYFNGMNCISCTLPLYFNFTSLVCEACQFSFMFDPNTKSCIVDSSKIYYTDSLNGVSNYIGNPPILAIANNKMIRVCPANTPFSNGRECLECSQPKFYNFQTNQCEKCSNELIFNLSTKSCSPKLNSGAAMKNSNVDKISNFMYAMPQYNDSLITCDTNAPYFNGIACTSCNLPSYFNFKTFLCQNCPSGQQFNIQNRLCEFSNQKFITDTNNQNIYYNGNYVTYANSINAKKQSDSSIQVCPSNTPFYQATTNQCIACSQDSPIFNVKYSKCISCGNDSSFDPYSRICIYNKKVGLSLERTLMNTFSL